MQACETGRPCHSFVKYFLSLALLALVLFLGSLTYYFAQKTALLGKPDNVRDTFTMSGHGEVSAIPDIALVQAGLETTSKGVDQAQKENTEKMNAFLKKVGELGVAEKDRKTLQYSIYPKYDYQRGPIEPYIGKQVLVGYTVTNTVELKVRNLERLSDVLGALGEFGLNQVGGFSFNVDDDKELKNQAMDIAILNARVKADRLAKTAGVKLGRMVSFSENPQPFYGPYPANARMMEQKAADSAYSAPTIEKGNQTISVDIQATYELLP